MHERVVLDAYFIALDQIALNFRVAFRAKLVIADRIECIYFQHRFPSNGRINNGNQANHLDQVVRRLNH